MNTNQPSPSVPEKEQELKPSQKWTYNPYRATLYYDGSFFAIVTPNAKDCLSQTGIDVLLDTLNASTPPQDKPCPHVRTSDAVTTEQLAEDAVNGAILASDKMKEKDAEIRRLNQLLYESGAAHDIHESEDWDSIVELNKQIAHLKDREAKLVEALNMAHAKFLSIHNNNSILLDVTGEMDAIEESLGLDGQEGK